MKIIITGFSGFVGYHLLGFLKKAKPEAEIYGLDVQSVPDFFKPLGDFTFRAVNLLDGEEVKKILVEIQPDWVIHLASFSSVAKSWEDPAASFHNNTNIFLNLVEGLRKGNVKARVLSVGSSEQYGIVGPEDVPLSEERFPRPANPYAVARVSQEMLSKIYVEGFGMEIILTRSFNHTGTFQRPIFFIPSMAQQIVEMKVNASQAKILKVGKLDVIRDFLDVRDVVEAYVLLMEKGKPGELYNVCSGVGNKLETLVKKLIDLANIPIEIHTEPGLVRPLDNPIIVGSNQKIFEATGWKPKIPLDQSLKDVYNYFLALREGA